MIDTIVLHHTASSGGAGVEPTLESVSASHASRLHPTSNALGFHIAYHALIFPSGEIVRTREHESIGYHAGHWETNARSLGVCLVGNFEYEKPTTEALISCMREISELQSRYDISPGRILAHREVKPTACPGKWFTPERLQMMRHSGAYAPWARRGLALAIEHETPLPTLEPDCILSGVELESLLYDVGLLHEKQTTGLSLQRVLTLLSRLRPGL